MKRVLFALIVIGLPCLLVGCERASVVASDKLDSSTQTGILEGQVSIGPNCPVESVDEPCELDAQVYAAHKLVVLMPDKSPVQHVDLDANGNFRTELNAGSYLADVVPHDIGIGDPPDPKPFEIIAGQTTILTIDIDTGIR